MESIVGTKPQSLQFLCTCDTDIRQCDRTMRPTKHFPVTGPSFATGRIVDFFLQRCLLPPAPPEARVCLETPTHHCTSPGGALRHHNLATAPYPFLIIHARRPAHA